MKKLILKTIFITIGTAAILLFAVFGVLSMWMPAAMMEFSASLGLSSVSGDYAFQEFERSGNVAYLAKSFTIAVENGNDRKAEERFDILFEDANFESYCESMNGNTTVGVPRMSYRDYLCGQAALVKYRLASSKEEKAVVCAFAVSETTGDFSVGNPVITLTSVIANAQKRDEETCAALLEKLTASEKPFSAPSETDAEKAARYNSILSALEGTV